MGVPMKKRLHKKRNIGFSFFVMVFVLSFSGCAIIGWNVFPTLEDGTIDVPGWYMLMSLPFSGATSLIVMLIAKYNTYLANRIDSLGKRNHKPDSKVDSIY